MTLRQPDRIRLTMQGFSCDFEPGFGRLAPWLRWTPALSAIMIGAGTFLRQPLILWTFALLALIGAAGWHPFDALFNHAIRHAMGLPRFPANPPPRRFAMALAAIWSALTGLLLAGGWPVAGLVLGGMLFAAAMLVAWTHFCIGSWIWNKLPGRA